MAEVEDQTADARAGCGVCCPPDPDILGLKKYDYKWLCLPRIPFFGSKNVKPPLFLPKDEKLPLLLAIIMGLQHALAVAPGIATTGAILISNDACAAWQKDSAMCESRSFLISTAWITSGLLTIIQVLRVQLRGGYYLGTGLISVVGSSFTFLPIAREMVVNAINEAKLVEGRCVQGDCREAGFEGYGKFLGTCMVASFLEIFLSLLPPRVLRKIFPPVVTGTAIMCIGGGLISSGIKYLGGGVFCADNMATKQAATGFGPHLCTDNGDVVLAFGAPQYIGLGISVILFTTFLQIVGSPFLKSTSFFWGLLFGMLCSGVATYEAIAGDITPCSAEPGAQCIGGFANAIVGKSYSYWNLDKFAAAPGITFLWNNDPNPLKFLGFAPEYLLPLLLCFFITTAESVGDIGASCDASAIASTGAEYYSRIQGGLLADGLNSFLAAVCGSPPNTTYSQNNGIIALTGCASRAAGFACAFWLILFGVIGKFGAIMSAAPGCVIGGLVLMTFTMVFVSGIRIATAEPISRRNAFILTIALAFGMGVAMVPHIFDAGGSAVFYGQNLAHNYGFWPMKDACKVFKSSSDFGSLVKQKGLTSPAKCLVDLSGGNIFSCASCNEKDCLGLNGTHVAAVYKPVNVETCIDNNGACCKEYDSSKKAWRTAILIMLRTPVCIGVIIAAILNQLLPETEDPEPKGIPPETEDPEPKAP